jgi:hypothetical protein
VTVEFRNTDPASVNPAACLRALRCRGPAECTRGGPGTSQIGSGVISRYELQPDRIVFYLWSWKAEGSHLTFGFTPRYARPRQGRARNVVRSLQPDLKVMLAPADICGQLTCLVSY